jgi:RNA polymerase sigma-70 factor (ECF subfamily)
MPGLASNQAPLLARARAGDTTAFEQLVKANSERVSATLSRAGLNRAEVEEVTQEVFLRAWRALPDFQERAQLSTWLHRIAINESRRLLARRPSTPEIAQAHRRDEESVARVPGPSAAEPGAHALGRELEAVLRAALTELPADARAAVVLRDLEGLSTGEAAGVAGVPQAAFKSRLHRGRAQLRAQLAPYLERAES